MDSLSKNIAQLLLKNKAVLLNPEHPFTYASGIRSPIYCDNRVLISSVADRNLVVDAFVSRIQSQSFDVIAGTATAGIAWAAWIADRLSKPLIYVRSSSKEHGRKNAVEGRIEPHQKILVIEDLISTGGSSLKVVELLRQEGHDVSTLSAIFTYEMQEAREQFVQHKVEALTLSCFGDLLEVARTTKMIDAKQSAELMEWHQDPKSWAKKHGFN